MRLLFIIISFLLFSSAFTQNRSKPQLTIPGIWLLVKNTITKNGQLIDKTDKTRSSSYQFLDNGTYKLVDKYAKSEYGCSGHWKIIDNGKKLHLFNNTDIPDDLQIEIADHDLDIDLTNGKYVLSYSSWDVDFAPNIDYYEKVK